MQGFGFSILYDPVGRIYIKLDPYYIGRIQGVCGNNDGDANDFISSTGLDETKKGFFESYKSVTCNKKAPKGVMEPCSVYNSVSATY